MKKSNKFSGLMKVALLSVLLVAMTGCSKGEEKQEVSDLGIGPVQKLELGAIDPAVARKGKELYEAKCSACHKIGEKYVGPDLKDVTKRRKPEWIMNMIMNPEEMTKKDPVAQELLATYYTQMTFQNLSEEEVRGILEYFREIDSK